MILPENLALWLAQSKAQADVPVHSLHSRIVSLIEEVRRLESVVEVRDYP